MMTRILLDLTEEYQNIIETIEDELEDEDSPLTIDIICDKLLLKTE